MKRGIIALAAIMVVGLMSAVPAQAYHELACNVQAQLPTVEQDPKRLVGRATTRCTNSYSTMDKIVVRTQLQWFCCTETQIQTIATSQQTFYDVSHGRTLYTRAVRACPPDTGFDYLFRTKVTTWVYDDFAGLLKRKVDFAPGGGLFVQRGCGDADGF